MLSRIRSRLVRMARWKRDIRYAVNDIALILPYDHRLPDYQTKFRLYDRKLGLAAQAVSASRPLAIGIDVGANVGDSAAMIRSRCLMPLLCVEGDEFYYGYLLRNADGIGGLTCVESLVGIETRTVFGRIDRHDGTSRLIDGQRSMSISTLPDIVRASGINPTTVGFIKIDTDGLDFDIILGSESLIRSVLPTLFFEHQVVDSKSVALSLEAVTLLASVGYQFVVFDNYGHTMRVIREGAQDAFDELNRYILSGLTYGGGIPYLDVFASADVTVFEAFLILDAGLVANQPSVAEWPASMGSPA